MKTQLISLRPKEPGLFVAQCSPCPRSGFCQKSAEQQCLIPRSEADRDLFFEFQRACVREVGGMEPRGLPHLLVQPRLAKVTHVFGHGENFDPREPSPESLGVYAREVVGTLETDFRVRRERLARRELLDARKVLVISAKDPWLRKFVKFVDVPFARSVVDLDFAAVMGPNLSGYHHNDHSVWLDNRAVCQQFMGFALSQGLPIIFHTYLEDSRFHQDWLVEYLRLNPSQKFLATGFDCNGTKNASFFKRRIDLLRDVQRRVGRDLHVVLHTVVTTLDLVRYAHDAFPRRIYLLGRSVVRESFSGTSLDFDAKGTSKRAYFNADHKPGMALFNRNARNLNEALGSLMPNFFDDPESHLIN